MVGKAGMFSNGSFDKKRMFDLTLKFLACRHALQKKYAYQRRDRI